MYKSMNLQIHKKLWNNLTVRLAPTFSLFTLFGLWVLNKKLSLMGMNRTKDLNCTSALKRGSHAHCDASVQMAI